MLSNQTLFKQSSSETQDSEREVSDYFSQHAASPAPGII